MHHPSRGGVRGGADQFSWDTVKTDKYRENYLGHSLKAPVGRWQKGKDLQWYNKDRDKKHKGRLSSSERDAIRQAEDNAINAALGHKPIQKEQQSLNKEDLAEALKRNQGDRDALDTERVEGVGIASGRASLLSGSGSKTSEGVDFVVPASNKKTSGMSDKKEIEIAKEISDEGKEEQFQESPQTDMKKKKHKKKDKKHKKKKKKKKKLMKLSLSGEKADRKGKKKLAQPDVPEKKATKEKIRHDSDSDSEAEERMVKEPATNLTLKRESGDIKKSLNMHHTSSKQEKDVPKIRHEETSHPGKEDLLKKVNKSEDKRREDKNENLRSQQRQSHKSCESEKSDQIRKHKNQPAEEFEGKKKVEQLDSSTDSEPRRKKSESKHSITQNTLHRSESTKNSKHKDVSAEKHVSEVSERHSLQKSRQDNASAKISDIKNEKYEKVTKDHGSERSKDKLEALTKTGKEKNVVNSPPKHHTESAHELSRQMSLNQKNEKSGFSKVSEHERKGPETKVQKPKDSQKSRSRFESEHKSEHSLKETENENISARAIDAAPSSKHLDSRNESANSQLSLSHNEKPEINKWQLDSTSESEDEKKALKYDDKHKFHEASSAYSLAKSNQIKKGAGDKNDKKLHGSRSSNKSKSSSDELTTERSKAKITLMASNEDSNSSDSHNLKTLVSKDYDNKSDRKSDLSGSEDDNSKAQNNSRKHIIKDGSLQRVEKSKSESPRNKEEMQKIITHRKISNESVKHDSSSSSSEEDKKQVSKKVKKRMSSSSSQEDKSDSDRESSPHKIIKSKKDSKRKQSSSSSSEDEREKTRKRKTEPSKRTKVTKGRKDSSSSSEDTSKRTTDKKSSKRDLSSDSYSSHSDHKSRRNETQSRHKSIPAARREDKSKRSPSTTDSERHSPPRGRYGERGHQSKARRDSSSDSEPRQSASRNWDDRRSWPRRQQWSRNWNDNRGYRWPQQRYQRNFGRRQIQPRWQNNRSNMDRQGYRQSQYSRNPRDRYGDSNRRRRDSSSESSGRGGAREREKNRRSDRGSGSRRRSSSSSDSDDHSKQVGQDSRGKGEKRNYRKRHDSSSDSDPRAKRSRGGRDNTKSSSQKRRYSSDSS